MRSSFFRLPRHRSPGLLLALCTTSLGLAATSFTAADVRWTPSLIAPDLSPNGRYLAAITEDASGMRHLVVTDLQTDQLSPLRGHERLRFTRVWWRDDARLIAQAEYPETGFEALYLVPRDNLQGNRPLVGGQAISLIDLPRHRPDRAIISRWGYKGQENIGPDRRGYALEEVDLDRLLGGRDVWDLNLEFDPPHSYRRPSATPFPDFRADLDGELALTLQHEDNALVALHLPPGSNDWQRLAWLPGNAVVKAIEPDRTHLWLAELNEAGESVIVRRRLTDGQAEEPILRDATYDLRQAYLHLAPDTRQPAGVTFTAQRYQPHWIDPRYARAHAAVRQRPDWDYVLKDVDETANRFLFHGGNGRDPGALLLVDLAAETVTRLADLGAALESTTRSLSRPIAYPTADGRRLDGLLTLPTGAAKENPAPLLVLLDEERALWTTFNPFVQYLASHGYAVLQPNSRPNSGLIHPNPLAERWDTPRVLKDILTAVRGVSGSGYVDPHRIAIMGSGMRGFHAAACATESPNTFAAVLTHHAVFDLEAYARRYFGRVRNDDADYLRERLADASEDEEGNTISPLLAADRLRVPVFIATYRAHINSIYSQARQLADSLQERKVPVMIFARETDHLGRYSPADSEAYNEAVIAFLAEHLSANP